MNAPKVTTEYKNLLIGSPLPVSDLYNWLTAKFVESNRYGEEEEAVVYAYLIQSLKKAFEKYHAAEE